MNEIIPPARNLTQLILRLQCKIEKESDLNRIFLILQDKENSYLESLNKDSKERLLITLGYFGSITESIIRRIISTYLSFASNKDNEKELRIRNTENLKNL